jgi:EpsD family peptidyl-prolyl cis-trans isomerase
VRSLLIVSLCALTLAGCDPRSDKNEDGRVSAVVNGVEITRREVDFVGRKSTLSGSEREAERRRTLAFLVRNELLARKASEMKLEKSPDFIVALYEARRNLLAGMAEQHIAAQAGKVSPGSVGKFIAENPRFFSQRKLLVYDQVIIPGVDEFFLNSLNDDADRGFSLDQLLDKVGAKKMPFRRSMQALTTDQIDPGILSVLSNLSLNRPRIARVGTKFSLVLMLRATVPMPLEGNAAIQAATGILQEQQRKMELSKTLTKAIDSAKITCFGEFASCKSGNKGPATEFDLPILP